MIFSTYKESKNVILSKSKSIINDGVNNQNVVVIGSVGSGKTYNFVSPNLLNKGCSYVITDVKGDLYNKYADFFKEEQDGMDSYIVKRIDFKDFDDSVHYNPFRYIHDENDILTFVNSIIDLDEAGNRIATNDSFWNESARWLLASVMFYIFEALPKEKWNIKTLLDIFNKYFITGNSDFDEKYSCEYKKMLDNLETCKPDCMALRYYNKIASAVDRTFSSILVTATSALGKFENEKLQKLMAFDDLDIDEIGIRKTALFITLSDTDNTYGFLVGLLYNQIFSTLFRKADKFPDGMLLEHVRFVMDDFACYGKLQNIESVISSARSRNISIFFILQSESQLHALYGDMADNIIANCTYVYLGGNDVKTIINVAQRLGTTVPEIQNNTEKIIVFFPNGKTIYDVKADIKKHRNYKALQQKEKKYTNRNRHKSFWDDSYIPIEKALNKEIDSNEECFQYITKKFSWYDSIEEFKFYNAFNNGTGLKVYYHQAIRDIFNVDSVININKKFGYKLLDMHCDFIFRDENDDVVFGVEIDGKQHDLDIIQAKNDEIKNKIFQINNIPLIRLSAEFIRNNSSDVIIYKVDDEYLNKKLNDSLGEKKSQRDIEIDEFKDALENLHKTVGEFIETISDDDDWDDDDNER